MTADAKNPESDEDLIPAPDEREQDRMDEVILLKLNDLEYRVDDLELCNKKRVTKQPGIRKEVCKSADGVEVS
ncbi:MAG: hypothetical protein Q7V05_02435 [Methanoregula sp.]|nr:hypothetical protein [Methanoregula sp.]